MSAAQVLATSAAPARKGSERPAPARAKAGDAGEQARLFRCACGGSCPRCRGGTLRPKLAINTPGDAFEREADAAADAVMSARSATVASALPMPSLRRCACG